MSVWRHSVTSITNVHFVACLCSRGARRCTVCGLPMYVAAPAGSWYVAYLCWTVACWCMLGDLPVVYLMWPACVWYGTRLCLAWSLPVFCMGPALHSVQGPLSLPLLVLTDSCAVRNGGCHHRCRQITPSQHECYCDGGYTLQADGYICAGQ